MWWSATNSTLSLTLNSAFNGINAAGGLTFQNNATNNFNYGSLTANPTAPAINVAGGISAPGSNIVINISATGSEDRHIYLDQIRHRHSFPTSRISN